MDACQSQPSSERETRPKRTQLLSNPPPQTFFNAFTSLIFSPRGEAKCVRGASVRGARLLAGSVGLRADVALRQYVEHGEQAQRSKGGPIACFGRQVVRKAG